MSGQWIPLGILAVAVAPFAAIPGKRPAPPPTPSRVQIAAVVVLLVVVLAVWLIT